MFLNKATIKENIRNIILDDNDNDIIFVVASKGIGKTILLREIYEATSFEKKIIVADGRSIAGNAVSIKKSYVEGIVSYVERHNVFSVRNQLYKTLQSYTSLPQRIEILIRYRRKKICNVIVPILCELSIPKLKEIYVTLAEDTPFVVISRDYHLSEEETDYFQNLHSDSLGDIGARVTHIIGLRPTKSNIDCLAKIVEMVDEKVFVLPMLPVISKESNRDDPKSIATISISEQKDSGNYTDFQNIILSDSQYFDLYESIQKMFNSSVNPKSIFVLANQEISAFNYDYIGKVVQKIYKQDSETYEKRILIPYSGKLLWFDALSYYLALQMKIEDAIKETQKFFLILIREICSDENKFCFTAKMERNSFISFIKEASTDKENEFAAGLSRYYADYAHLVNVLFRYKNYKVPELRPLISSIDILDRLIIDFTDENLEAMERLYESTQVCSILDMCFQMITNYFNVNRGNNLIISEKTTQAVSQFLRIALVAAYKWWDLTLLNEFVEFEKLINENYHRYIQVSFCELTRPKGNSSSAYDSLLFLLSENHIRVGDIFMPKNTIFLSYAQANEEIADIVDSALAAKGYSVVRDIRDVKAWDNLREFMESIRAQDYVVFLVSDTYLRRDNCLFEVMQFLKETNFKARSFPIALLFNEEEKTERHKLEKSESMFSPEYQAEIVHFWQERAKSFWKALDVLDRENSGELDLKYREIKQMAQIAAQFLNDFFANRLLGSVSPNNTQSKIIGTIEELARLIDERIHNDHTSHMQ